MFEKETRENWWEFAIRYQRYYALVIYFTLQAHWHFASKYILVLLWLVGKVWPGFAHLWPVIWCALPPYLAVPTYLQGTSAAHTAPAPPPISVGLPSIYLPLEEDLIKGIRWAPRILEAPQGAAQTSGAPHTYIGFPHILEGLLCRQDLFWKVRIVNHTFNI